MLTYKMGFVIIYDEVEPFNIDRELKINSTLFTKNTVTKLLLPNYLKSKKFNYNLNFSNGN